MDTLLDQKKIPVKCFLDVIILNALRSNAQIAVWRKPKENKIELIIDSNQKPSLVSTEIESLPPGYILHPFQDSADKKAYFINAENYYAIDLASSHIVVDDEAVYQTWTNEKENLPFKINQLWQNKELKERIIIPVPTNRETFLETVQKGVDAINCGDLFKIVPAKVKIQEMDRDFDLTAAFLSLCQAYPNGFVNFFHIPQIGTWIGASPEVLIKTRDQYFYTMALAGTQRAQGENPLKSAAWTQKEIEEQALVSRYIVNCFKKIRLREYDEIGPKTSIAGPLLHLKSEFKVDMEATNFPQLGSVMLDLLHPTSAVCGMPREKALEFLSREESFDRSFFAGYLGPVNIHKETAIFVNLRCARLLGDKAILFAGAGITEDSIPEKEWEETELKCDIIGKFLQKTPIS
ncbi:chorismate-binding protein [Lunatibacter salilacus]|uniref:chorismate-binding protein n=1 Tax=Lunatibacter salilacus TaxID=2483804 RepID=UPI00131E3530|nr:chorismate-binding protein [Lunatibacter salilacus]